MWLGEVLLYRYNLRFAAFNYLFKETHFMKSKNVFLSLVLTFAVMLSSVSFSFARFDEGMFAPAQIAGLPLKKRGLKIKPEEIYNPAGGGLTEAVIRLSSGCTAEFVSPDGLILTNHHCGFEALVSASTPDKDLVETGLQSGQPCRRDIRQGLFDLYHRTCR